MLTKAGQRTTCQQFLNSLTELMSSMSWWIHDDSKERTIDREFLWSRLQNLDEELSKAVWDCCLEAEQALADYIFTKYSYIIQLAIDKAPLTVAK
jgi:hypothetical protein